MRNTFLYLSVLSLTLLPPAARGEEDAAPDDKQREQMTLCTDGKSHYVAVAPDDHVTVRLYYGDGKRFFAVPRDPSGMVTGDWFPEPRRLSKTNNPNFRGVNLRLYSRVDLDRDKGTCAVICGDKRTALQVLEPPKAKALLQSARFEPPSRKWAPYALARDNSGNYYYVDRGYAEKDRGRFRLFVGPKGKLAQAKMTNVVSDSEGDIFSTKTGSLRLVLDRRESIWIENERPKELRLVPVEENLPMIYNELGVYVGDRLGTPCDDF